MTATNHRRPCRRCGHDEHAHGYGGCSVAVAGRKRDPFCSCPGYRATSDEQPAEVGR